MNLLETIIASKWKEIDQRKQKVSMDDLCHSNLFQRKNLSLKNSLLQASLGIIAEFKRKSPSKGWIQEHADVQKITSGYDKAGASGISILTDAPFFGGDPQDLITARPHVGCPILRKDFIVDEYQLYEARAWGADVVLLIAAALSVDECKTLAAKAHTLGLEVLLEVHDASELVYIDNHIDMVGVNNRNLKTFEINIETSLRLAPFIPDHILKISESGIESKESMLQLRQAGYRGFLIGERFMRAQDSVGALKEFLNHSTS